MSNAVLEKELRGGIGLPRADSISLSNDITVQSAPEALVAPKESGRRTDHHNFAHPEGDGIG